MTEFRTIPTEDGPLILSEQMVEALETALHAEGAIVTIWADGLEHIHVSISDANQDERRQEIISNAIAREDTFGGARTFTRALRYALGAFYHSETESGNTGYLTRPAAVLPPPTLDDLHGAG